MSETILEWVVIVLPTLFAIAVEVIDEEYRKDNRRWRIGVISFGIVISVLTGIQVSHAHRVANRERQEAILETSTRVSSSVSESVTQNVTQALKSQYESTISDLRGQIATLQTDLAKQGRKVDVISSSDIVSGKQPIKVEMVNKPTSGTLPQVAQLRLSWENHVSIHPDAPYCKQITIQSDSALDTLGEVIRFSGPLKYAQLMRIPVLYIGGATIRTDDPKVVEAALQSTGQPIITPSSPVELIVCGVQDFSPVSHQRAEVSKN